VPEVTPPQGTLPEAAGESAEGKIEPPKRSFNEAAHKLGDRRMAPKREQAGPSEELRAGQDDQRDVVAHAGKMVLALGALGIVYGDIGTSPLYTEQVIFNAHKAAAQTTVAGVYGVAQLLRTNGLATLRWLVPLSLVIVIAVAASPLPSIVSQRIAHPHSNDRRSELAITSVKSAMTGSPVLAGNTIYTGVSANGAGGPTATFLGEIVALNAQTGRILWRTYSLPDNGGVAGGYAGATMFAPPTVDLADGLVYGTFGQPYTEPASVTACHAAHGSFTESCEQPGSYLKSIVAFDLKTGEPQWSYRVQGHDPWQRACGSQPPTVTWCAPESDGEKWDLGGSAPNVMRIQMDGHWRNVVGLGEKSGVYILFDAKNGEFLWNTLIGPGGDQGGMEWGTAFDGDRIYASITNQHHIPYRLTPSGAPATGGSWAALDPVTGQILWQTGDPVGAWDLAPLTSANGLVYASSMAKTGYQMFALDAATGAILWRFAAGSSVNSGPAVVDSMVFWGSGYARAAEGNGNNKLYAFSLDGK